MAHVTRITPNLWFPGNAGEAVEFYVDAFDADSAILHTEFYPETGLPAFQQQMAGELLTADFSLRGHKLTAINAGDEFRPNPAISFMLNFDPSYYPDAEAARADLNALWEKLSDGGRVLMPLQQYPFSEHYGWAEDRYGVSWQLMLTDPAGEQRPFLLPALMFGQTNQNRAAEAVDYWTKLFPDSRIGQQVHYPEPTGPATTDSVMFSDMMLYGQWFVATDSGVEQDFTFNEAVSFLIECDDQTEIDQYWEALSADPEAEQCGWCKDQFGVSWQIVPKNMNELMQHPGAYQARMGMGKIVVADFDTLSK